MSLPLRPHGRLSVRIVLALAGALLLWGGCPVALAASATEVTIVSPSGLLAGTILVHADGHLRYTVTFKEQPVVLPSPLGITVNAQDLGQDAELGTVTTRDFEEVYPVAGVHAQALNRYHEATVQLTGGPAHILWTLEVRTFDDGIAWRYRVPGTGDRTINGEATGWHFPAGGTLWYQDGGDPAYESVFVTTPLDALPLNRTIDCDCTIRLPGDLGYVLPTEADVRDYSALLLQHPGPRLP